MGQSILHKYQLAEARGHIPSGVAERLTMATILEAGIQAFHRAYYGDKAFAQVMSEKRANASALEIAGTLQESLLSDVKPLFKIIEAHTTTDFPLVLANIRDRTIRKEFNPYESNIFGIATERTTKDFKQIKGIKYGNIDRLNPRPEGTDVTFASVEMTEDGYSVINYERGVEYSWEAFVNDDLSVFTNALVALGIAAKRNRVLVVMEAMAAGIPQETIGGAGGPDNARLKLVRKALANLADADGNKLGLQGNKLLIPTQWADEAAEAIDSELLYQADGKGNKNILRGRIETQIEKLLSRVTGDDWFLYDGDEKFLEIAYLEGFQAGPKTYTQMPDVEGALASEGSFKNHTYAVKVGDVVGGKVVDARSVKRIKGA